MSKPYNDEAYILIKADDDSEGELFCFGFLLEKRTSDGELLEMFLEPLQGEVEELIGDNLLYFCKKKDFSYVWADFEAYPDCEQIELDEDEPPTFFSGPVFIFFWNLFFKSGRVCMS
jgi:hypothetical protein